MILRQKKNKCQWLFYVILTVTCEITIIMSILQTRNHEMN